MTTYEGTGVRGQQDALSSVARHLEPTFKLPRNAEVLTGFGAYASVMKISDRLAIAIATDGVGSKTVIASALGQYDTVGFDCVAMNVNDVLCVGATPIALVDYVAVNTLDAEMMDDMLRGLGDAASDAGIAIPGGEMAQLPDVVGSDGTGDGDPTAFDLVGTCVGTVDPEKLILGADIAAGDVILGLASSGLHSNGYSLVRRVLLKSGRYELGDPVDALGRSLGEELLEPTLIYVRAATALWDAGIATPGLVHITGDGLANMCRLETSFGFVIDSPPSVPPIFSLIQDEGGIDAAEMYKVFNMGVGFVIIVPASDEARALERLSASGYRASRIGYVSEEPGGVILPAQLRFKMEAGEPHYFPA